MELRQLEAFVAVATELHFGHAAARLNIGQPTLSDLIKRLERELQTPLLTRTTRRVALTAAGSELLTRSAAILDDVAAAKAAVRRVARGVSGTIRLGVTPPAAPVLAQHLVHSFAADAPEVTVQVERMWLPALVQAVADGDVDIALTCGLIREPDHVVGEMFCAERLLVALRPHHRLASAPSVALADLADEVLGSTRDTLFPAWALSQRQALDAAGVNPPTVELLDTDLYATRWMEQDDVQWVMTMSCFTPGHEGDVIRPVTPELLVPFGLHWNPDRVRTAAAERLVTMALTTPPPPGWRTLPSHLHHDA